MKKFLFFTLIVIILNSLLVCAAPSNPFTDADYLREDFGINDYKEYVIGSIDDAGIRWPEGTKIISSETSLMGKSNVKLDAPVFLPDDIEIIGHAAFMGRKVTDEMVDFTKLTKLKYIGKYAFCGTGVHRVDLSNTQVVRIGEQAFETNTVTAFIAPPTLKRIDASAVPYCTLGVLKLNEGLEYIGANAFKEVSLSTIRIPSTVKYIGQGAFPRRASFSVAKGSYAEEWCKNNGLSYSCYTPGSEVVEKADDTDVTKNVGHFKVTKYYAHFFRNRNVTNELKLPIMTIRLARGGLLETLYDNMEVYYAPNWDINSPQTGTTSKDFEDYYGRPLKLSDKEIYTHPSQKLDVGWQKGLRWEFEGAGKTYNIMVLFEGKLYNYQVIIESDANYFKYKNTGENDFNKSTRKDKSTTVKIIADSKEFNCEAYNISGNNYFRLRDIAFMINGSRKQFGVLWNEKEKAVEISKNSPYTPVGGEVVEGDGNVYEVYAFNLSPVFCEGYEVFLDLYNVRGNNYIKLRDIGKLLDFNVSWSETDKCIIIDTANSYKE